MDNNQPFISIGLPVYNGARFLRQALDSLIGQDYENIQIIISDNASNDATAEIAKEYVALDRRISYHRHENVIWATGNFNHVFNLSDADYFMWASHNVYWDKRFISTCLEAFKRNKNIVLVGTMCRSINVEDNKLSFVDKGVSTIGLKPRERFIEYMSSLHRGLNINGIFYGIYKSRALRSVMPMKKVIANDHLLLAQLCFEGEFFTVEESLFYKRQGGMSASFKAIAEGECIRNRLLIGMPYLTREMFLQKMIFETEKLNILEKIWLSGWSFTNYLRVGIIYRGIGSVKTLLSRILPSRFKLTMKRFLGI